jgi:hypothetical protein
MLPNGGKASTSQKNPPGGKPEFRSQPSAYTNHQPASESAYPRWLELTAPGCRCSTSVADKEPSNEEDLSRIARRLPTEYFPGLSLQVRATHL